MTIPEFIRPAAGANKQLVLKVDEASTFFPVIVRKPAVASALAPFVAKPSIAQRQQEYTAGGA